MPEANERQVGGGHYKTEYEHWDYAIDHGNRYLEGLVSKYVTRWRNKDGIKDLEKAGHTVEKLIESVKKGHVTPPEISSYMRALNSISRYARANKLDEEQTIIVYSIHAWSRLADLESVHARLVRYTASQREGDASPAYVGQ